MINISDITEALVDQLNDDAAVAAVVKSRITRGNYINEDPGQTPWAGVYRAAINYEPRTLGLGAENWEGLPRVRIVAQATSMQSGEDCENELERFVKVLIDAVLADTTVGGTVDMVTGFDVEYSYSEELRTSLYFQTAIVTFNLEVATS